MSAADFADTIQRRRAARKTRFKPAPAAQASTNHYDSWNPLHYERELELRAIEEADQVLENILNTLKRRHSYTRHVELCAFIDSSSSFHKLCDIAQEDVHEMRRCMRFQIDQAEKRGRVNKPGGAR